MKMDRWEREHYQDLLVSIRAGFQSRRWYTYALIAERNWLRNPPMDYREFKEFCRCPRRGTLAPDKQPYAIAVEFFTTNDFLHPPAGVDLTTAEQHILSRRDSDRHDYCSAMSTQLDVKLYEEMLRLWNEALGELPSWVREVIVIAKKPVDVPFLDTEPARFQDGIITASNVLPGVRRWRWKGRLFMQNVPINIIDYSCPETLR